MKLNQSALSALNVITNPHVIVLYSGIQPSINDYVTNFSTNYSSSGTNTLQIYNLGDTFLTNSFLSNGISFRKATGPDTNFSKQSIRSGTATWSVFFYDILNFDELTVPSLNISNNNQFIIVPVSNLAGLGILKLRNTTVTYSTASSDNLIADCIIDVQLPVSQIPTTTQAPTTTAAPTTTTTTTTTTQAPADGTAAGTSAGTGSDTGTGTGAADSADSADGGGDGGYGDAGA